MIRSIIRSILLEFRRQRLRFAGATINSPRLLASGIDCRPGYTSQKGCIAIGHGAWIEQGAVLHAFGGSIKLGRDVFLGHHTVIYGHGGVEIGDACLIGMHCCIVSSNHTIPSFRMDIRSQPDILQPTRIGRDVWLGAGVTVLGGVTIGDGCVVGAGAVVTKSLRPGAIAYGIPAVAKGSRLDSP